MSFTKTYTDSLRVALENAVGSKNVFSGLADKVAYARNVGPAFGMPDYVVRAYTPEQVSAVLMAANRFKVPVTPVSSRTFDRDTIPLAGGIVLDTSDMTKIIEIDEDEMYALVEPGVTIGQLNVEAHKKGLWAPTGSYPPWISVMNYLHRSNKTQQNPVDELINVEMVLPTGEIIRTGSAGVGAGWHSPHYAATPYLQGILLSACGRFGVVTKMACRLYPLNEEQRTIFAHFDNFKAAFDLVNKAIRARMVEHGIVWHYQFLYVTDATVGETGIEAFPENPWEPYDGEYSYVTFNTSGYKRQLDAVEEVIGDLAKELGGRVVDHDEMKERHPGFYKHIDISQRQRYPSKMFLYSYHSGPPLSFIVLVGNRKAVEYEKAAMKWLWEKFKEHGIRPSYNAYSGYFHPQDMGRAWNMRTGIKAAIDTPEEAENVARKWTLDLFREYYEWALKNYGGVAQKYVAATELDYLRNSSVYPLWKKIKKALDPNDIMNPGHDV